MKSNIMRQATEAVLIQHHAGSNLLNRRGEWGQNLPPKLVVEDDFDGQNPGDGGGATKKKRKKQQKTAVAINGENEVVVVRSPEADRVHKRRKEGPTTRVSSSNF